MMLRVHALQPVERDMGVNLRRRNIGVAEDSLHGAQVSAIFHHVGGTGVSQRVRTR